VVDGLVLLALRGVDPNSRNSESMPKVRASSGMIGTTRLADVGVAAQVAQQAGERRGGARGLAARTGPAARSNVVSGGQGQRARGAHGAGAAAERPASRHQVVVLHRALRRAEVRRLGPVRERPRGSRSSRCRRSRSISCSLVIFLIWWVALRPSTSAAERPALDGLGQDDGRAPRGSRWRPCRRRRACGSRGRRGAGCAGSSSLRWSTIWRRRGSGPKKCSRM
jgi:hypothetical protein